MWAVRIAEAVAAIGAALFVLMQVVRVIARLASWRRLLPCVALVCCFAGPSWALTCTTTTANLTAATVQAALNAALNGDVVCVPTGSATWSTGAVTLPSDADVTLAGSAGAQIVSCSGTPGTSGYACTESGTVTDITCGSSCLTVDRSRSGRITGFRLSNSADYPIEWTGAIGAGKHFRIDHNRFVGTAAWRKQRIVGTSINDGGLPAGVIDHNRFEQFAIHVVGTLDQLSESNQQHVLWATEPTWGHAEQSPFIESNYFTTSSNITNYGDGNYGARAVIRYNTYDGPGVSGLEFHSVQGQNRSYQHWEIYKNHFANLGSALNCFWGPLFIRGGTGPAFGNSTSGTMADCDYEYVFDNVRSDLTNGTEVPPGECDGASAWDQNTAGEQGWRCRDQIGISHDVTQWEDSPAGSWNQNLKPAMAWDNLYQGALKTFDINQDSLNPSHIVVNRDYYDHSTATGSPQTVGVRSGVIANRPANCTTGVGYWATDEGDWYSGQAGADGRLYKCTATNTWTLYYTPYTYPHPWADDGAGRSSVVLFIAEWAALLVGISWHLRAPLLRAGVATVALSALAYHRTHQVTGRTYATGRVVLGKTLLALMEKR